MYEISPERHEQAMGLIRVFCARPYRDHGKKRTTGDYKGWFQHDWGHLVQRVYRTYFDRPLDIPSATIAAKGLRSEFPHQNDWDKRVKAPQAQARILELIEAGIEPFAPQVEQPVASGSA